MTKTVVLLNPYGTDVTDFVNGTAGVPQLLKGTIMAPGDTLYTLPYDWNASSLTNIETGAGLLDTYLHATSGQIRVFAYSEGGQIADYWLTHYGPTSTVSTTNVSFLLVGNADRKYGGFVYGQAAFNTVAYTGGKPAGTPYSVVDFTRQYDPIGDFPNATPIVDALAALETLTVGGTDAWAQAIQAVADVVASTNDSTAALNAVAGLALIHLFYEDVTPGDAGNVSLVEGTITWVWSPTYPIPLLGASTLSPRSDQQTRPVIEGAFDRPVTLPTPDYSALIAALAPSWATQVPSAPVQQPPGKAYQVTQPSSQQVAAMQQQLLESIWQGFLQIVDGFLLPDTSGSDQLAAWWADLQATFNSINASLTQNWLNFQNLINSVVGGIDKDVMDLIAALNSTSDSVAVATANWDTLFLDLGFSVTTAAELAAWLGGIDGSVSAANADITDIVDSFAPGGTVTEFQTGVTNLLALVGLTPASIGGATVIDTVWTAIITDIINPLNAIEIAAVNGLASALSALLGTGTFQSLLDGIANVMGHSGTGHTIANIETYLGLIPPANVTNVLGGSSLGADVAAVSTSLYGGTTVSALTTVEQDIANFLSNAISGGSAPTSTNSPVAFLNNLLGINGIPHVNVAIPPNPGTGTITWDANASATPYAGAGTALVTVNHNHTCGSSADYLIARIGYYSNSSPILSVTYNGQAMSPLTSATAPDGKTYETIYGLSFPPVGSAYQLSVTVYGPIGASPISIVAVESDSYIGVGSVGSTAVNNGTSTSLSASVSSASGDYIVQGFAFATGFSSATLGSYNRTQQYNSGTLSGGVASFVQLAGDAAGASSVSFTASTAAPGCTWAGAAVNLIPLPAAVLGSTFRAANTSTTPVTSTTGNNLFPNSFFNTTVVVSNDLSYSAASGNTVTIAHAGTYSVTIAVLLVSGYVNQWVGMNLIQNGGTPKRGHTSWIGASSSSTVCAFTFQVVCSAGDTLQPGYNVSLGASSFTATTDGLATYFEVSLNNRGLLS